MSGKNVIFKRKNTYLRDLPGENTVFSGNSSQVILSGKSYQVRVSGKKLPTIIGNLPQVNSPGKSLLPDTFTWVTFTWGTSSGVMYVRGGRGSVII